MSLWTAIFGGGKKMAGGGSATQSGSLTSWHEDYMNNIVNDPLAGSRAAVKQLQSIDRQTQAGCMRIGLGDYVQIHAQQNAYSAALNAAAQQQYTSSGQINPYTQAIGVACGGGGGGAVGGFSVGGGGGGGFTSTTALGGYSSATTAPRAPAKPIFDPGWFNDYLEAREGAVVERLSGD